MRDRKGLLLILEVVLGVGEVSVVYLASPLFLKLRAEIIKSEGMEGGVFALWEKEWSRVALYLDKGVDKSSQTYDEKHAQGLIGKRASVEENGECHK